MYECFVVDDDPSMLRLVSSALVSAFPNDIVVTSFVDPKRALQRIDNASCDFLITDKEMPEVDGMDLLQAARRRSPWTQVIFLTAHRSVELLNLAMRGGALEYLVKPFQRDSVVARVNEMVRRADRWRDELANTLSQNLSQAPHA